MNGQHPALAAQHRRDGREAARAHRHDVDEIGPKALHDLGQPAAPRCAAGQGKREVLQRGAAQGGVGRQRERVAARRQALQQLAGLGGHAAAHVAADVAQDKDAHELEDR